MDDLTRDPDEEAALWVVRLAVPEVSEADALAFDAWLAAAPVHRASYDRALRTWLEAEAAAPQLRAELGRPERIRRRRAVWGGLAAAAALAVVLLPGERQRDKALSTAQGERRTVQLADGSVLTLNAGSRMSVRLARAERRVEFAEGEVIFDVAHDRARPFVITVGDQAVRVLGTRFGVRRRDGELSVTVAKGLVEVGPRPGASGGVFRLRPGQRLERREGSARAVIAPSDPAEAFSWASGRLVARDQPLGEVVAELNRQFPRPIRIDDPELADMPVTGVLVLDSQEAVLRRLALLLPIEALPSHGEVRLRPR